MTHEQMSYLVGALIAVQAIQAILICVLYCRGTVHLNGMNSRAYFAGGKPVGREAFEKVWNDSLDDMKIPRRERST